MDDKILVGFIGAVIALALRELAEWRKRCRHKKQIAALCLKHLQIIKQDFVEHVKVDERIATFNKTLFCEIAVGDFLYELITKNITVFGAPGKIAKTMEFFHHYKVNMATIDYRIHDSDKKLGHLSRETYANLLAYLDDAMGELNRISKCHITRQSNSGR